MNSLVKINKKEDRISKILRNKKFWSVLICICVIVAFGVVSYAASPAPGAATTTAETKINELVKMIAGVFQKIAGVIIFMGAIQVAWSIKTDNPEAKSQGLKTIAAGVLVFAVASGSSVFMT
jgi:hypothetical protein